MIVLLRRNFDNSQTVARDRATVEILPVEDEQVSTTGAVDSVQEAEVTLPVQEMRQLWKAETLERLARAYWAYTMKLFLGLIRVVYAPDSTTVVLVSRRIPLLRFNAPEYEVGEDGKSGRVIWPIDRGLLVSSTGRGKGQLRISVRQLEEDDPDCDKVHVRVAVRNFYPWLRGRGAFARFGTWLYSRTQLAMHVIVCNGFLRSLARLDFPEPPVAPDAQPGERDR